MTDQELIELLQQKPAGELTSAELELIRTRWKQSPALQQALQEYLQLESELHGGLATVQVDVETILKRAAEQPPKTRLTLPRWSWLIGLSLVLLMGVGAGYLLRERGLADRVASDALPTDIPQPAIEQVVEPGLGEKTTPDVVVPEPVPEVSSAEASSLPVSPPKGATDVSVALDEPWSAQLSPDSVLLAADSLWWQSPPQSTGHDEFSDLEAKRWFAPVDGHSSRWTTELIGVPGRRTARFQGLSKLRAPWPTDAVLRLTPFEVNDLALYFWRGSQGIALRYYARREPQMWGAFEISREGRSPLPDSFGLLTTDSGAYSRSGGGTLEVRHQQDHFVLARGGTILLSVPCSGPPEDVFIEGQFRLRGVSMHRSEPFSEPPENPHPVVISGAAASLPWAVSSASSPDFTVNEDGSITFVSQSADSESLLTLPVRSGKPEITDATRRGGLYEVIVNIESAEPGTGIFLGNQDSGPLQRLGFFLDPATQRTTFGVLRPEEKKSKATPHPDSVPTPFVSRSCWLKLIAGLGTLHIMVSGDGQHWGAIGEAPGLDLPGAVNSMGLFVQPGMPPRKICVSHIEVRELSGVTQMADPQLRSRVPLALVGQVQDLATWLNGVLDAQPGDVETEEWLSTCAVVALEQGPPKETGGALLRQLVSCGLKSDRSFEQKRLLIDDAVSLCDLFDETAAKTAATWYQELGGQLAEGSDVPPMKTLRPLWLRSPLWTDIRMAGVWDQLESAEVIQSIYQRDWNRAWERSQAALFWHQSPQQDPRLTDEGDAVVRHAKWAKCVVAENLPQLDDGTAGVLPVAQRHPLVPVLSKEAYNIRAELQSALAGHAYEDACRTLMTVAEQEGPGLLPDLENRQLYVSMSTAIQNARRKYPGLVRTMEEKYEPLGQIRVKSAVNRKDVGALETATVQFMGTDAARSAHLWLGDLALSSGQFDAAEQHFDQALVAASPSWKAILLPRKLLAQATGGRSSGTRLDEVTVDAIDFNGTQISRSEFQRLLDDVIQRPNPSGLLRPSSPSPAPSILPGFYRLERRAQFDGDSGNLPGRHEYRDGDPFGRQFAVTADEKQMFLSNRFEVGAYSVEDGRQLWTRGLGNDQGDAYALAFHPMKPLLTEDHLFIRRLTRAGVELACLRRENGQIVWQKRTVQGIVSDPMIWNGRLFALTADRGDEDTVQVEATWFEPSSGAVIGSSPLFGLRDWQHRLYGGQLAISDQRAVCTLGGTVACFDARGVMHWLKKSMLMQKPVDELAEDTRVTPPVIESDRVVVSIPGVREVQCLSLESGMTIWERPIANLRGLIGVSGTIAIADTTTQLVAMDTRSGKVMWRSASKNRLEACCIADTTVLTSRRVTREDRRSRPLLTWRDLQTGRVTQESLVDVPPRDEFQMGPMWSAGGKWWSLVGVSWKNAKREIHEFVMVSATVAPEAVSDPLAHWDLGLSEAQFAEIQTVLPGWYPATNSNRIQVVSDGPDRLPLTLRSRLEPEQSARWISRVRLEPARKQMLQLRVGHQPGQTWQLAVRVADQIILEQSVGEKNTVRPGWKEITVDLSPWAGQDRLIQLIQSTTDGSTTEALWKSAVLVTE